jgi:FKBP-type peptidyl-prolyl cis-trans isomerase FkpA/FKBP-type peptidyl-prolyl cis-trans isomerase FklB
MRTFILSVGAFLLLLAAPATAASQEPGTEEQKTLYALGLAISQSLATFSLTETELDMVKTGMADGVLKRTPKVDLQTYGPKIQQFQQTRLTASAEVEKKAGAAFTAKAISEKGSTKTESGIVITPLKPGTGATPKATDTVKVHYHGTLVDGTVFDSSLKREPATFPLDQVIKCWTEGLQQIKVGGKSRLVCPANLAYGDRPPGPPIKAGSTLVFEVELLEIVQKENGQK